MNRICLQACVATTLLLLGPATVARADRELDELESYSYVAALDGTATLTSAGQGPGETAELNQPLLAGDAVRVARGARVEIALADRNLLRVGGDSAVYLSRIAFSGDRGDRTTRLELEQGEVVLVVSDEALGDALPELRAGSVEVVIHEPGTYRVRRDASGWTEVVVREGFAEVATADGSVIVRSGEAAIASTGRRRVDQIAAGARSPLELWGEQLLEQAAQARNATLYVEPELAYRAAPMAGHGTWLTIDAVAYWQPRVEVGWRPYTHGRWAWTPSGLTWVSYERWGWVPYHYGTWSEIGGYGWVWRPGRRYSPAWVYWHVSDAWTGWIPVGYYTNWYRRHGWDRGFGWGSYGWAGGSWSHYDNWCFRPTRRVCDRDWRRWHRGSRELAREHGPNVPRGILTTDTRGVPRHGFDRPEVFRDFERRARSRFTTGLPDVTDFVARKRDLPPTVVQAIEPRPTDRIRIGELPRSGARPNSTSPVRPVTGRPGSGSGGVPDLDGDVRSGRPTVELGGGRPGRPTAERPAASNPQVRAHTGSGVVLDSARPQTPPRAGSPVTPSATDRTPPRNGTVFDSGNPAVRTRPVSPAGDDRQRWRADRPTPPATVHGSTPRALPPRPATPQVDRGGAGSTPPVQRVVRGIPRAGSDSPGAPTPEPGRRWERPQPPASGNATPGGRVGTTDRPRPVWGTPVPRTRSGVEPTRPVGPPTAVTPRPAPTPRVGTPPTTATPRPPQNAPRAVPPPSKPSGSSASPRSGGNGGGNGSRASSSGGSGNRTSSRHK